MKRTVGSVEFSRVSFNHAAVELNRLQYVHTTSCAEMRVMRESGVRGQPQVSLLVCSQTQGKGQEEGTYWQRAETHIKELYSFVIIVTLKASIITTVIT